MGKTKTAVLSGEAEEKKKKKTKPQEEKQVKVPGLKGGQRVVAISGETLPEEGKEKRAEEKKAEVKEGTPKVRGKKYKEARAKIDKARLYSIAEAIKLLKETSYTTFDGTVELHATVRKVGLTANTVLPHSTGKKKRIEVASEDTIKKLSQGKVDFDVLLATADMMPKLVPFAKLLGPRGLMPNPKTGTLIKDKKAAEKFSSDTLTIKTQKDAPLVHTAIGKVSQGEKELEENARAVLSAIGEKQILSAHLTATMSPSVKLQFS